MIRHAVSPRRCGPALGRLFASTAAEPLAPATTCVRQGHELDVSKLLPLLADAGAIRSAAEKVAVSQFSHGQSNPTYLLSFEAGPRLVLRKQPPGKLLRGAHAVDREFRCMSALGATAVPVPAMRMFCDDPEVLGTPFLVCDYVSGRFFDDPKMGTAASPQERSALYGSFLSAIAALHTVDYKAAGLGDFGKEGGYVARQTKVWTSQYRAAETESNAAFEKLLAWLPEALPAGDDALTTLVHGDLRVDNCIFAHDSPEVVAMLDWELATLGDPATDLALATLPYDTPTAWPKAFSGFGADPAAAGIPAEQALVDAYVSATGLTSVASHLDYYRAFCCFRMASILQGVYKRSLDGQASSADGSKWGKMAGAVAGLGVDIAERYERSPDRLTRTAGAGAAFASTAPASASAARAPAAAGAAGAAMGEAEYEALKGRLIEFMHAEIYPNEQEFARQNHAFADKTEWVHPPLLVELMAKAKAARLWNLFLPVDSALLVDGRHGAGLTNLQYADLCEIMGTSIHAEMAAQATNTTSPDTGNMETLARFGSDEQKERWLKPLLEGKIRSCFAMTEPDVASSDATNISISIRKEGGDYVINGRKWCTCINQFVLIRVNSC